MLSRSENVIESEIVLAGGWAPDLQKRSSAEAEFP
jgi:hypothetical protein